jgi:GT2 family glycosyltransferase
MPLISVIIPVFNGEKTLKRTVESILNQTFSDFELIVINDGSQDKTLEILATFQDPRLRVFSYPNGGLSMARNRGIAHASGAYLSFIDADDLWTPDKLEAQLAALQADPQAAVAYSWTDWIDEADQFLRPGVHVTANGDIYEQLLLRDFIGSGSNILVKTEALADVGGFDASVSPVEDWDMWLRLAARYQYVAVSAPQILYRITQGSMSSNVWKMESSSMRIIERAFENGPASLQPLKPQVLANRYQYLTLKAIERTFDRQKALTALRYWGSALRYNPQWLRRSRLMAIIAVKIAIALLLPTQQAQTLWQTLKNRRSRSSGQSSVGS